MKNFWSADAPGIVWTIIIAGVTYLLVQAGGCMHNDLARFKQEVSVFMSPTNDSSGTTRGSSMGKLIRSALEFEARELPSSVRDSLGFFAITRPGRPNVVYACRDTVQAARMMASVGRCISLDFTNWASNVNDSVPRAPEEFMALSFSRRPQGTSIAIFTLLDKLERQQGSTSQPDTYLSEFLVGDSLKAARHYLGDIREGDLSPLLPARAWLPKWYLITLWVACSLIIVLVPILRKFSDFKGRDIEPTIGWALTFLAFAPGWALIGVFIAVYYLVVGIGKALKFNPLKWWRGLRAKKGAVRGLPQPRQRASPSTETPSVAAGVPTQAASTGIVEPQKSQQRWFFIRGFVGQLDHLKSYGIPVDLVILPVSGEQGLVFPENETDLVAANLGIPLDPLSAEPTTKEHVYALCVDTRAEERLAKSRKFAAERSQVRGRYVEVVQSRLNDELTTVQRKLDEHEARRRKINRAIVTGDRQVRFLQKRSLDLRQAMTEKVSPEWLGAEFDHLCDLPEVQYVEVGDRDITVYTNLLYAEEEDHRGNVTYYELGEFELVLHAEGHVRMNNLTHKRRGKDHPGLMAGTGCLGNLTEALPRHIAKSEYVVAIQMMIAFLTRDARGGFRAGGWREVPNEVAIAARAPKRAVPAETSGDGAAIAAPSGHPA